MFGPVGPSKGAKDPQIFAGCVATITLSFIHAALLGQVAGFHFVFVLSDADWTDLSAL